MHKAFPTSHQLAAGSLYAQIYAQIKGKGSRVFCAPYDVRLFEDSSKAIVQPDVLLVLDKSKLEADHLNGTPDMVAEVITRESHRRDRIQQRDIYCHAGVKEFWIIDPEIKYVEVFLYDHGVYRLCGAYEPGDNAKLTVVADCSIDIGELFPD
ncbi:Uma2 family endonuclease [Christensenellaceae bacterium OttesenSCG-928-M15]|nr:Uma2 family endonuclease [Christensenellaceae bacterium OttesenSCG-928-M15]